MPERVAVRVVVVGANVGEIWETEGETGTL